MYTSRLCYDSYILTTAYITLHIYICTYIVIPVTCKASFNTASSFHSFFFYIQVEITVRVSL